MTSFPDSLNMLENEEAFEKERQLARSAWYLIGATASGKSEISLHLAESLNAEIISLDSMAIYRFMDIGTAKPPVENRQRVPHHLIDLVDPDQEFSVSDYCNAAFQKVTEIRERGKEVLFVGGTALYLKSMIRGVFQGPSADWEFRRQVEQEIAESGHEHLIKRLELVDPLSAHKLHPNDTRRIIRALEVYRATGTPISHLQTQFDEGFPAEDYRVFCLRWPREILHQRIDRRVDQMFERGFVDEAKSLRQRFGQLSRTASQAVGYKEVFDLLDGKIDEQEVTQLVKNRTHQFARHQETWFRGLTEVRWIEREDAVSVEQTAQQILSQGNSQPSD